MQSYFKEMRKEIPILMCEPQTKFIVQTPSSLDSGQPLICSTASRSIHPGVRIFIVSAKYLYI